MYKRLSLGGTKVWADDHDNALNTRPEMVEIILLANGSPALDSNEEPITQSIGNTDNAAFTFTDLPKYDQEGKEITYSVTDQVAGYTPSYDAESNVLTNIYNGDGKITVTKNWQDGDNAERTRLDEMCIRDRYKDKRKVHCKRSAVHSPKAAQRIRKPVGV